MTELLRNAWLGWQQFTTGGKLSAILMAVLLYLWLGGGWKRQKGLYSYTALMMFACIFPVSAMVLMLYQTRFYDYEWLWSLVPMTVVIAWGITEFLDERWKELSLSRWKQGLPVTVLLLVVLVLCSGFGQTGYSRNEEQIRRNKADGVIDRILELQDGDICLWAPREIMEYARERTGRLSLVYGRNMWEEALNAYTYDVYSQEYRELYLWMENADPAGTALIEDGARGEMLLKGENSMMAAAQAGISCVLLPGSLNADTVETLAKVWGGSARQIDGYYLLTR
ncbi:MAG: hypothetical protein J1E03_08045 [Acetatifactor sp.]|nr:hypothetical protein [Acetatifactor sp.]